MTWFNQAPGISAARTATHRSLFLQRSETFLAQGRTIDGTKSRDPGNTGDIDVLRAGMLMGMITSGGKWAPSILGVTTNAEAATSTTIETSAATALELSRRVGTTGTFKLTGPPAAAGTVRTLTATYSAVNTSTGAITVTALGVNEVQTVNLVTAGTAGNVRLIVPKPDGTLALTPNIAWNATDATVLSNANTALDTATGVVGGLVATAIAATDTDLGFVITFAGTGYAGLTGPTTGGSWPLIEVHTLFTSNTGANVVRTTTGVTGAFAAGSFIQPTDGSETIRAFISDLDGYGVKVTDIDGTSLASVDFPRLPISGVIDSSQLINWPSDTSLRAHIVSSLNAAWGGQFVFDHQYSA
jgi:hypothetical protein